MKIPINNIKRPETFKDLEDEFIELHCNYTNLMCKYIHLIGQYQMIKQILDDWENSGEEDDPMNIIDNIEEVIKNGKID